MTKALERREKLRADLIQAAERMIAERGLAGLKTRDLAREIGCANGAVYNLVADVDELVLRVGSRTLLRLDKVLSAAVSAGNPSPQETLVRIAIAYCDFAAENLELWRAMFEHRMAPGKEVPDWSVDDQWQRCFRTEGPKSSASPHAACSRPCMAWWRWGSSRGWSPCRCRRCGRKSRAWCGR
jgi:AcrR family transcriptional regulator